MRSIRFDDVSDTSGRVGRNRPAGADEAALHPRRPARRGRGRARTAPPTIDPMLAPPIMSIGTPASSSARTTPRWAKPRGPPPPSTTPTLRPAIRRASRSKSESRSSRRWWWAASSGRGSSHRAVPVGSVVTSCRSTRWRRAKLGAERSRASGLGVAGGPADEEHEVGLAQAPLRSTARGGRRRRTRSRRGCSRPGRGGGPRRRRAGRRAVASQAPSPAAASTRPASTVVTEPNRCSDAPRRAVNAARSAEGPRPAATTAKVRTGAVRSPERRLEPLDDRAGQRHERGGPARHEPVERLDVEAQERAVAAPSGRWRCGAAAEQRQLADHLARGDLRHHGAVVVRGPGAGRAPARRARRRRRPGGTARSRPATSTGVVAAITARRDATFRPPKSSVAASTSSSSVTLPERRRRASGVGHGRNLLGPDGVPCRPKRECVLLRRMAEVGELTLEQQDRRRRLIDAAFELGAEGGYDAVQMRDVAVTANVALATIYRYFSSKDHLLAAAMTEWTGRLQGPRRAVAAPRRHRGRADGRRAAPRLQGDGAPAEAERGARAGAVVGRPRRGGERRGGASSRSPRWATTSSPTSHPQVRADILAVLGHVWYSALDLVGQRPPRLPVGHRASSSGRASVLIAPHERRWRGR